MTATFRRGLITCVVIAALGVVHWRTLRPGHEWGGDFAMYVRCAANLAEGRPFGETGYIYNPHYPTVGPPTYPPGCSVLLAPVYRLAGLDLEAMKLAMVGSLAAFLLFALWCLQHELPYAWALAVVLLTGLNRVFLGDANSIGSDLPFMAILYLTLLLVQKAYEPAAGERPRPAWFVSAVLLMFAAYATRTVGVVLPAAMLACDLLRYRRLTPWAVAGGAAFALLALGQSMLLHSDAAYLDQYHTTPGVFAANAAGYVKEMAGFWHNGYFKPAGAVLFGIITVLAAAGLAESVRRRRVTILEMFFVLYLAAVLLFPGYAGRRYLQPVFPLYLLFAVRGVRAARLARRKPVWRAAAAALAAAVLLTYAAAWTRLELDVAEGVSRPASQALFQYVREHTAEDDVVVFIKPRVMALYTSRRSSAYHTPDDDRQLWDYFRRIGADHLVVVDDPQAMALAEDPERLEYLRAFARRNAGRLQLEFRNEDFSVYRLQDAGDLVADAGG